jgi:hypothetical protein
MAADVAHGHGECHSATLRFPVFCHLRLGRNMRAKTHTRRPGGGRLVANGAWDAGKCATRLFQDYFLVCFRNMSSWLHRPQSDPLLHDKPFALFCGQIEIRHCGELG